MTLITRLSKLTTPGTDTARTDLAHLIHRTLREAETSHELLTDETPPASPASALLSKAGEDLKIARRHYRKALLTANHNAARAALFTPRRKQEKVAAGDVIVSASSDVTAALQRTRQLLQGELEKSRFASETLAQSSEALKELGERYNAFDDVLGRSTALIRDLVKRNKSERWYYESAIRILVGMLVWIIVRRLFWGPLWLLVVWPLKTVWWAVAGLVGLGVRSGTGVESVALRETGTGLVAPFETGDATFRGVESVVLRETGTDFVAPFETEDATFRGVEKGGVVEEEEEEAGPTDAQTMLEAVGKIIDGSTTILRNTMSRRFEEPVGHETEVVERPFHTEPALI